MDKFGVIDSAFTPDRSPQPDKRKSKTASELDTGVDRDLAEAAEQRIKAATPRKN